MKCTRCKEERGLDFPPGAKKRREAATKESQKYHNWCRRCHNEVKKQNDLEVSQLIYSAKSKPCADCGKPYHPLLMDFDHRPGTIKRFTIGAVRWSKGRQALQDEIAKCDVVCVLCHRIRTWNRKHPEAPILRKDIVRTARRRAEAGRNDQPLLFIEKANS